MIAVLGTLDVLSRGLVLDISDGQTEIATGSIRTSKLRRGHQSTCQQLTGSSLIRVIYLVIS